MFLQTAQHRAQANCEIGVKLKQMENQSATENQAGERLMLRRMTTATAIIGLLGPAALMDSAPGEPLREPAGLECHFDGVVLEPHIRKDGHYEGLLRGLGHCGLGVSLDRYDWQIDIHSSGQTRHLHRTRGSAIMIALPSQPSTITGTFRLGHNSALSLPYYFRETAPAKADVSTSEPAH